MGDAVHVTNPTAGQGMTMAIEDAAALARHAAPVIAAGADDGAIDAALAAYERERRPINAGLLRWSHFMGKFFAMRGAIGSELRARVFALGGHGVGQWIQRRVWNRVATRPVRLPAPSRGHDAPVAARWSRSRDRSPALAPRADRAPRRRRGAGAPAEPVDPVAGVRSDLVPGLGARGRRAARLLHGSRRRSSPRRSRRSPRCWRCCCGGSCSTGRTSSAPTRAATSRPIARSAPGFPASGRCCCSRWVRVAAVADWAAGGVLFPYFVQAALLWAYYHLVRQHWGFVALYRRTRPGRSDTGAPRRGVPLARLPLPVRALLAHAGVRGVGPAPASPRERDGSPPATSSTAASRWRRWRSPRSGSAAAARGRSAPSTC